MTTNSTRSASIMQTGVTVGQLARQVRRAPSSNLPTDDRLTRLLGYLRTGKGDAPRGFDLLMFRRQARELRRVLFGSKGLNSLPEPDPDDRYTFDIPDGRGWWLRLTYLTFGFEKEELPAGFQVSETWKAIFRHNDHVMRYGKEEFHEVSTVARVVFAEFLPPSA